MEARKIKETVVNFKTIKEEVEVEKEYYVVNEELYESEVFAKTRERQLQILEDRVILTLDYEKYIVFFAESELDFDTMIFDYHKYMKKEENKHYINFGEEYTNKELSKKIEYPKSIVLKVDDPFNDFNEKLTILNDDETEEIKIPLQNKVRELNNILKLLEN